ncbi:MAG: type II toxin-antitoxin system prevent-host-death family antitoxin [bacterium]
MEITASEFRKNLYNLLARVIDTGVSINISLKGKKLRLVPCENDSRLKNLKKRTILNCDPQEIVHLDWSHEWNG